MLITGMIDDVQVKTTPDLKDKTCRFNFLTKQPLKVIEVHLPKDMVNANMFEGLEELEGQEVELAIDYRTIKFQPDPTKPMIDITKFELFKYPEAARKAMEAKNKASAKAVSDQTSKA